MSVDREYFLGTTDVKVSSNLLRTLKNNDCVYETKIVQKVEQQGRVLIEIAELFSAEECEAMIANLQNFEFESIQAKYDKGSRSSNNGDREDAWMSDKTFMSFIRPQDSNRDMLRNNARLVVMDNTLADLIEVGNERAMYSFETSILVVVRVVVVVVVFFFFFIFC
jgi:hypothetical protein